MKKTVNYKLGLICIKYIPVIMFLIMWIHTGLLLLNIHYYFADTIVGCSLLPSILILSVSNMFNFCALHKTLTIYALLTDICINIGKYIGFGIFLFPARLLMFISGLVIFIILLTRFSKFIKCKISLNEYFIKKYKRTFTKDNR